MLKNRQTNTGGREEGESEREREREREREGRGKGSTGGRGGTQFSKQLRIATPRVPSRPSHPSSSSLAPLPVRPWQTQPFSTFGFLPSSAWHQVTQFTRRSLIRSFLVSSLLSPSPSPLSPVAQLSPRRLCCCPLSRHLVPGPERRLAARRAVNRRPIRRGCCAEIGTFRSFPFLFLSFRYAYFCPRFIVLEFIETRVFSEAGRFWQSSLIDSVRLENERENMHRGRAGISKIENSTKSEKWEKGKGHGRIHTKSEKRIDIICVHLLLNLSFFS